MRVSEGSQQVAEDRRSFWLKESVSGIGILLSDCLSGINVVKILPGGLAAKDGMLQVDDVLVSMEGMDVWDQKLTGIVDLLSHVNIRNSVVSFGEGIRDYCLFPLCVCSTTQWKNLSRVHSLDLASVASPAIVVDPRKLHQHLAGGLLPHHA